MLPMNLITAKADSAGLSPELIAAIAWACSQGHVYAVAFEAGHRTTEAPDRFAKGARTSVHTERTLQKQRFGLMQLFGSTARSLGYCGSLGALYKPENNLYWGCKYVRLLLSKYPNRSEMLRAYRTGKIGTDTDSLKFEQTVNRLLDSLAG